MVSSVNSPLQRQRRDCNESNCLGEYDVRKTLFTADNIQSFPDEIIEEDLDFSPLVDTADLNLSSPFEPNIWSTTALHKYVNDSSNSNNCVVCSESDPEKLQRVLKGKRGNEINWQVTSLLCFFYKIGLDIVGKSTICYKHHAKWYNFYRKYKDTLSSIFEGEANIVTQTDQIKVSPTAEEDSMFVSH